MSQRLLFTKIAARCMHSTYKPSFNGCGTAAFPMQAEGEKYGLTVCCNEHDLVRLSKGSARSTTVAPPTLFAVLRHL